MDKSIKHKLVSGGLWVVGVKIIGLFSGVAVTALLARLLTLDEMGVYFLIFSLVTFSTLFSLLGMDRSVVRIVSESLALEQTDRARDAVKYVFQFGLVASIIVAILLVSGIGQWLSEKIFNSTLMAGIIYYAAIWVIIFTIQRLIVEVFRGFHDIRFAAIFNGLICSVISTVILSLILWKHEKTDIYLVLSVIIAAYAINVIFALAFLLGSTGKLSSKNARLISRSDIMRTSWPLYLTTLLLNGLQQSHLWLLAYYSVEESVAIYGAVLRLLALITVTLDIVRFVIAPMISELYAKKRYHEVEKVLRSTATIAGVPSLIALLIVMFFGKSILLYLYGSHYTIGYTALLVLSLAHLINVLTGIPAVLLVMASKEKFLLLSAFVSGSMGICLSILLVGSMDYLGVCIGAGVGIVLQNLFMAGYCLNKMSINTFMSLREVVQYIA